MATLILSAVGTAIGGPIGGAIGAFAGQQIDQAIFAGGGTREGPKLKDLSITTSTYGAPISQHFGKMRVGGTIIWATDLVENSEKSGGGKGSPSTRNYSYTTSMAVALGSRPIAGIGRIWADGNLLRGASGDLKSPGQMRFYSGFGDQPVDPLLAAAIGAQCPAYRGCAYVVFEDLSLEDFGNRIPALTFEILDDASSISLADIVTTANQPITAQVALPELSGVSYEGGSLANVIGAIEQLYPIYTNSGAETLSIASGLDTDSLVNTLPTQTATWKEPDTGSPDGLLSERDGEAKRGISALRYYDTARDYQPGIQRTAGPLERGAETVIEFPGSLSSQAASSLIDRASHTDRWAKQTIRYRLAELDPALVPGSVVNIPDRTGNWLLSSWEWRESGIELELKRLPPRMQSQSAGDAGAIPLPADQTVPSTHIRGFELPWDGYGDPARSSVYAAVSAQNDSWAGAALFVGTGTALSEVGTSGRVQSVMGVTDTDLPASHAIVIDRSGAVEVSLISEDMTFSNATPRELANGGNRILLGEEIVQFCNAEMTAPSRWKLSGLLRGRGGTEHVAASGTEAGAQVTLLDGNLIALKPEDVANHTDIYAIGRGDKDPAASKIEAQGRSSQPLSPVHPRNTILSNGDFRFCWTRRARGAWGWPDTTDIPLNEERERYRVGVGDDDAEASWEVEIPEIQLTAAQLAAHTGKRIWVVQLGRFAQSARLDLGIVT